MDTKRTEMQNGSADAANAAADAAALEEAAKAETDSGKYTHTLKAPFTYQGVTVETLTFDWNSLTGEDHVAIENDMLMHGKTLVTPEFSSEFLCGMAVRACTARTDEGFRVLSDTMLKALPMRDFQTICKKARSFLLRVGS